MVQKSQNRLYNRVSNINNNNNNNCSSGPENLITQTSNVIDADVSDNNLNVDKTVYFNKSVRPGRYIIVMMLILPSSIPGGLMHLHHRRRTCGGGELKG